MFMVFWWSLSWTKCNISQKPGTWQIYFIWRYATHVDGWNRNLRSMSTERGMFAMNVFRLSCDASYRILVFEIWFVWSLSHNVLTKTWQMLVFEMRFSWSLLEICNTRRWWNLWWRTLMGKSMIQVHKKWVVCSPWFLRYVFGEVCHGKKCIIS